MWEFVVSEYIVGKISSDSMQGKEYHAKQVVLHIIFILSSIHYYVIYTHKLTFSIQCFWDYPRSGKVI